MVSGIKLSKRDRIFLICTYTYVTIALLLVAYPILYIISASISDPKMVASGEMWLLPKGITFKGYEIVFQNSKIWTGYGNTILYTLLGTTINLVVTMPAAYALSRKDFVGRGFFMGMFMVTMFIGGSRPYIHVGKRARHGQHDVGTSTSWRSVNLEYYCLSYLLRELHSS